MIIGQQGIEVKGYFIPFPLKNLIISKISIFSQEGHWKEMSKHHLSKQKR